MSPPPGGCGWDRWGAGEGPTCPFRVSRAPEDLCRPPLPGPWGLPCHPKAEEGPRRGGERHGGPSLGRTAWLPWSLAPAPRRPCPFRLGRLPFCVLPVPSPGLAFRMGCRKQPLSCWPVHFCKAVVGGTCPQSEPEASWGPGVSQGHHVTLPGRLVLQAARSGSHGETDLFVCIGALTLAVRGSGWRPWGHTCPRCRRISVLVCIPGQLGPVRHLGHHVPLSSGRSDLRIWSFGSILLSASGPAS